VCGTGILLGKAADSISGSLCGPDRPDAQNENENRPGAQDQAAQRFFYVANVWPNYVFRRIFV
jgi:hypothetical protein